MEDRVPRGSQIPPPVSHRFSMFERWQENGSHSYVLGDNINSRRRMSADLVVADPRLDLDRRCHEDSTSTFVDEKSREPSLGDQSDAINPFEDHLGMTPEKAFDEPQNPFNDSTTQISLQDSVPEQLYHVFIKRQKWSVVIIIGIAGLFSGLSSNIYNPALNSIAQVKPRELPSGMDVISDTLPGSKHQPQFSLFNDHVLPDRPGSKPLHMGCLLRCLWSTTDLYSLFHCLYYC